MEKYLLRGSKNRLLKHLPEKNLCHSGLDPESSIQMDARFREDDIIGSMSLPGLSNWQSICRFP